MLPGSPVLLQPTAESLDGSDVIVGGPLVESVPFTDSPDGLLDPGERQAGDALDFGLIQDPAGTRAHVLCVSRGVPLGDQAT
jgi:hypothetical protein